MNAQTSLIEELENTIRSESPDRLSDTLQRVTSLFISSASRLDPRHVDVFDDVMLRLTNKIETGALAELSEQLAPVTNAPLAVVRRLAHHDEILVAGPVLSSSMRLTQSDLIEIAESKGQAHLHAIARRVHIKPPVTDVLVRRGDTDVLRQVAGNAGANFSKRGIEILAERTDDDEVMERILQRHDVPPHIFCSLLVKAKETVRQHLLAVATPEQRDKIHRALDKVSDEIADSINAKPDYGVVIHRVMSQRKNGRLTDQDVAQYAQAKQFEETMAALSLLSTIPVEIVEKLITGQQLEPALILCRAADLKWPTVRGVIWFRRRKSDNALEALTEACDDYNKLSLASAKKVLSFWQSRGFAETP